MHLVASLHMSTMIGVADLVRAQAGARPDHVALVVDGAEQLTYGAWQRRSSAVARGLAGAGARPGDRVGLFFDNAWWTDYAISYLAVHKVGAVAVPLSPRFSPPELVRVLDHAGVTLLVSPPELGGLLPPVPLAHPGDLEARGSEEDLQAAVDADDLAEIIYTSGTTGGAKGVACSHASILVHDLPGGRDGAASFLHSFPIGTNAGQECLRMPLRRLATAVVLPSFDPERLCAAVAERRIRGLQLVPAMAQLVVASGAPGRFDVSSVERVTLSSAPAPPALWARLAAAFPGAALFNAYALTESGSARTVTRYDPARPGSVGRPVGRGELRVTDDAGIDVAAGETGEVLLRGPGGRQREYYRDRTATAAAFVDGWLKTGDLGHLDEEGYLHLVDRKKDVIISGGLNISSVEVENALHEHPAVVEAAVFGVTHDVLGEDVAAAVVVRTPTDARELQACVRERLGEHKVPRRVFFVEGLPRNASGKVVKRELRERFAPRPAVGTAASPRSDTEAAVAAAWQDVLGLPDVGVHDDFFELGGHSLAAAQVVARLQDAFDVELPPTLVFERPTVAELAATVAEAVAAVRSR